MLAARQSSGSGLLPSPIGRRCPAGADEGTGEASCTQASGGLRPQPSPQPPLRAPAHASGVGAPSHARRWRASRAVSLRRERGFERQGSLRCRSFPSPFGRRCPAGADEGTGEASCTQASGRLRPQPSPQPPLRALAHASGVGAPPHARPWRAGRAVSPRREGGFERQGSLRGCFSLLPAGEGAPKGRMRVGRSPLYPDIGRASPPGPHPNPSPGGRGASSINQVWSTVLVSSRFSRGGSGCSPCTRNQTFSAMLVAWSPMRSRFLAMNSRCVHGVMLRGSSIM